MDEHITPSPAKGLPQLNCKIELTRREWAALAEAVRFAQETSLEGVGKLDPTLSRIQRKLGDTVGAY